MGATELQGPNTYNYKDLKSATNNFSEKNKIGEGGFGDVYKVLYTKKFHLVLCFLIVNNEYCREGPFYPNCIFYPNEIL